MTKSKSYRILFLLPGPVPPNPSPTINRIAYLSKIAEGVVLNPTWWKSQEEAIQKLGAGNFPEMTVGHFAFKMTALHRHSGLMRKLHRITFYWREGCRSLGANRYDAIVCYGCNLTGLMAALLSWRWKVPLILEIPGVPDKAYIYDDGPPTFVSYLRRSIADVLLVAVGRYAAALRLLYKGQLERYRLLRGVPKFHFHEFTPIKEIRSVESKSRNILFMGSPFYLKGVDTLIHAFNRLNKDFPDWSLTIVGHSDYVQQFTRLIDSESKINIRKGVPYGEAISLIQDCEIFVLPSRTEGMGKVLLESMAASRPVVASRVDGIPHYVISGENGLLFESGNVNDLSAKLGTLMSSEGLRQEMGRRGYAIVHERWSEARYVERFSEMLDEVSLHSEQ